MSQPRTAEERKRIVKRCVEIEKEGGDVIAYLLSENYISAKATWHNMQKYDLKRSENQITSGRPTVQDYRVGKRHNREELSREALEYIEQGKDPRELFRKEGFASPGQAWIDIKAWMKKNQPAMYDSIPEEYIRRRVKEKPTEEQKFAIPPRVEEEKAPAMPKPGEPINKYRVLPLRELKRRLQAELARAAMTDIGRACEIAADLQAIERVQQLWKEQLREQEASA